MKKLSPQLMLSAIGLTFVFLAQPASAELEVCNRTIHELYFAVGYKENGEWVSEGWWTVPSTKCKVPVGGDLSNRHYYIYAERTGGEQSWGGDYGFCTDDKAFTIRGDGNCLLRGYAKAGFFEVDTGEETSYRQNLTASNREDEATYRCECVKTGCGNGAMGGSFGLVHTGVPWSNVRASYGPERTGKQNTGWKCDSE